MMRNNMQFPFLLLVAMLAVPTTTRADTLLDDVMQLLSLDNVVTLPENVTCPGLCDGFQAGLGGLVFQGGMTVGNFTCGAVHRILQGITQQDEGVTTTTTTTDPVVCADVFDSLEALLGVDLTSYCDCPVESSVTNPGASTPSSCLICPNAEENEPPEMEAAVVVRGSKGCDYESRCPCLNVKFQSTFIVSDEFCTDLQLQAEEMGCCNEPWPTPQDAIVGVGSGGAQVVEATTNGENEAEPAKTSTTSAAFVRSVGIACSIAMVATMIRY